MRKIGVFFDAPEYDDYPFDQEEYSIAYHELAEKMHARGGAFYIVRGQNTFLGEGRFSGGWLFDGAEFVPVEEQIDLDVVYDKGHFVSDGSTSVINDRELDDVCVDKWKTCELFPEYSPKTRLVKDKNELIVAIKAFSATRVVVKPTDGEEGRGVLIGPAEEVLASNETFPALVQEFIDTSGGIPGVLEGMHDLRLHSVDGKLVFAYVRMPAPGKLLANVAQGGTEREVPVKDIPADAVKIFDDIDRRLSKYKRRVYSIDLGRDRSGTWKVIELNSKPGLSYQGRGPGYRAFQEQLVNVFLS